MSANSSASRFVARRLLWGVGVIWATLTICFAILWLLPATRLVGFSPVEMGIAATEAAGGSLIGSYLQWMESFLTLEWQRSTYFHEPVVQLYVKRIPVTLVYLIPGLLVSSIVGTGLATYAATERDGTMHRALSAVSAIGLSIPSFVLAFAVLVLLPQIGWVYVFDPNKAAFATQNLIRLQIASAIVGLAFLAVQIRHAQTETIEHLRMPFVKTARAKGAGRLRISRHIFRNAWPSMASLIQGEALGLLLLSTIVTEWTLRIPGVAVAMYKGFASGDPMLTFTAVFGMVTLGVTFTLAREFTRVALDPQYGR